MPENMLTAKGKTEMKRATQVVAALLDEMATEAGQPERKRSRPAAQAEYRPPAGNVPADPKTRQSGLKSRFMRWLGRGGT